MFRTKSTTHNEPDDNREWLERSEFWQSCRPSTGRPARKYFHREPLILCGHGAGIRVDHGSLLIRNGFTHHPQKQKETRLFFGDPNLPDRIVMLDGSGQISFDALAWMSDQRISLVKIDWRGNVSFVSGNSGYSAKKEILAAQNRFRATRQASLFSRYLLEQKIRNSILTLKKALPKFENREIAISGLENALGKFLAIKGSIAGPKLLGIEGGAAFTYFRGWHGVPLKWRGLWGKPIPPSWREIGPRTMTWRKGAENARHPVNAMLNYAYSMLVSQVRGELVAQGVDPTIGITHGTYQNRIPLVYDLMEPLRPVVDLALLKFVLARTFAPADFTINRVGACRINPQLATTVASEVGLIGGTAEIARWYLDALQ